MHLWNRKLRTTGATFQRIDMVWLLNFIIIFRYIEPDLNNYQPLLETIHFFIRLTLQDSKRIKLLLYLFDLEENTVGSTSNLSFT